MIARRVVNRSNGVTLYKDYPCQRTTAMRSDDLVSLTLVGGDYDGKVLSLKPGSPDLLVTMERDGDRPGDTVEVFHEPGWYNRESAA